MILKFCQAFFVLPVIFFLAGCGSVKDMAKNELKEMIREMGDFKREIVTEKDLEKLPAPVQKYLRYAGVVGKEKTVMAKIIFSGKMKLSEKQNWVPVEIQQVDRLDKPARLFYIKGNLAPFISMDGRDGYFDGKGNLFIRLMSIITVADAKGREVDSSELVNFLNDMVIFPSAFLYDYVKWETVDDYSAKAVITDKGQTVSGTFYFNDKYEITNMISYDRYRMEDGKNYREKWSTPFTNYREMNGVMIPSEGGAVHQNLSGGEYLYAWFEIKDVQCNTANLNIE